MAVGAGNTGRVRLLGWPRGAGAALAAGCPAQFGAAEAEPPVDATTGPPAACLAAPAPQVVKIDGVNNTNLAAVIDAAVASGGNDLQASRAAVARPGEHAGAAACAGTVACLTPIVFPAVLAHTPQNPSQCSAPPLPLHQHHTPHRTHTPPPHTSHLQVSQVVMDLSPELRRSATNQAREAAVEDATEVAQLLAKVGAGQPPRCPRWAAQHWHVARLVEDAGLGGVRDN